MENNISPLDNQHGSIPAGVPLVPVPAAPTVAVPLTGLLRLSTIIGDPAKGIPAIIPVSKSTWWKKCKTDPTWPQPVKLSVRCTAWLAADVLALVDRLSGRGIGI